MKVFQNEGIKKIIFLTPLIIWLLVVSAHGGGKTKMPDNNNNNTQQPVYSERIKIENQNNEHSPVKNTINRSIDQPDSNNSQLPAAVVSFNSWTGWSEPIW